MANVKMPFGKHRGKRLISIPTEYLVWLRDENEDLDPELRKAVDHELSRRDDVPPPPGTTEPPKVTVPDVSGPPVEVRNVSPLGQTLAGSIRMMFRNLALKYHPDRGGSQKAMEALNELHDQVQELITRTFST
jgi:hypothetical protein